MRRYDAQKKKKKKNYQIAYAIWIDKHSETGKRITDPSLLTQQVPEYSLHAGRPLIVRTHKINTNRKAVESSYFQNWGPNYVNLIMAW